MSTTHTTRTIRPTFASVALVGASVVLGTAAVLALSATSRATPAPSSDRSPDLVADSQTPATEPNDTTDDTSASLDGEWSTRGSDIVDGSGAPVRIRGINWFGFETQVGAPHGLWSRNSGDMLDQIAELGFNTIRVPFSSAMLDPSFVPNGINEHENPELVGLSSLEVLDRIVAQAAERGLAIVLDRHTLAPDDRHHLWYDDEYPAQRFVDDWTFLAERYSDHPNVIGADLYNEPHDEACWGCGDPSVDWKAAAETAGNAIHTVDPDWLIFVEGVEESDGASCDGPDASQDCTWWGGNLSQVDVAPIELNASDKVVYSPHEYATSVFRQRWFDDPDFPSNMPEIWTTFWGELEQTDTAPVVVGEFGTTLDNEIDAIWLESLLAYLDEIGAGFTFWTFNPNSGDTGGILQDDWTTVDTEKLAFLEPYLLGPFEPVSTPATPSTGPVETSPPCQHD